eukprot:Gb_26048 [translate_table: standard]
MTTTMDEGPSTKIPFKKEKKYDVFLSFRGPDVRTTFVDHLYCSLTVAGIHTFIDSEELLKGKDIEKSLKDAIDHSEILIPIFSPHYAESKWCLKELCLMCSSKSTIVPLFYNVEPSDVRYPEKGPYAQAFQKHVTEDRHSPDTVNGWKKALKEVSDLSGWSLEATRYEGKLVKEIVMDVLKRLDIICLDVAQHPVGLDPRKNELIKLLKVEPSPHDGSVLTVGIHGMGGLGKTTLSKAIFNDIHSRFEASSFVSDVRESAQQFYGLRDLQRQILMDLTGGDIKVNNVDHGKMVMRKHLRSKRVLVILDDVDNKEQLDALGSDWFGGGSRIIVTTRNKHVLNVGQADEVYAMEGLEFEQALELFSWHAFLRVCPDTGFEGLSERIVNACKGLPLSLEVIGAHLFDKGDDRECWDEALRRIESVQDQKLFKTMKISYDGLNYEEQKTFLDIACFFLRHNHSFIDGTTNYVRKNVSKLSKASNTAVKILSLKSLLRVDEDDCFVMHDILRDLGRRIVTEESPEEPVGMGVECNQGTTRVRSLLYSARDHDPRSDVKLSLSTESLLVMTNLQFLSLDGICIEGKMGELPPTLKWLKFDGCTLRLLASEWNMERLVFLQLTSSRIVDVGKTGLIKTNQLTPSKSGVFHKTSEI